MDDLYGAILCFLCYFVSNILKQVLIHVKMFGGMLSMVNLSFKATLVISQHDAKSSVLGQLVMKTIKCTICRLMCDFLIYLHMFQSPIGFHFSPTSGSPPLRGSCSPHQELLLLVGHGLYLNNRSKKGYELAN